MGFVIYVVAIEIIRAEKRNFEFLLVGFFFFFFFLVNFHLYEEKCFPKVCQKFDFEFRLVAVIIAVCCLCCCHQVFENVFEWFLRNICVC